HIKSGATSHASPQVTIQVGADSCTDSTVQIAKQFPGIVVTEMPGKKSKWATINALVTASSADWVILVDVGAVWPQTLLTDIVQEIQTNAQALAIAPGYRLMKSGWMSRILWQ